VALGGVAVLNCVGGVGVISGCGAGVAVYVQLRVQTELWLTPMDGSAISGQYSDGCHVKPGKL
jgi:hypothetical protein